MSARKAELVSIVLSVHNGDATLLDTLRSIERQSWRTWELVVIDDASTDATPTILTSWSQQTTRPCTIITNTDQLGLTKSLNKGIAATAGSYVARIDADDTWHRHKLKKQIHAMRADPALGVVGTWYVNKRRSKTENIRLPASDSAIRQEIWKRNPFGHSCVLIRKEVLLRVGGYREQVQYAQDRDLWFRLMPHTRFANIPEYLCTRSTTSTSISNARRQQAVFSRRILCEYLHEYKPSRLHYRHLFSPFVRSLTPNWLRTILAMWR